MSVQGDINNLPHGVPGEEQRQSFIEWMEQVSSERSSKVNYHFMGIKGGKDKKYCEN